MLPPVVLLADYAGTLDISDRSEARLRTTKGVAAASGQPQAQDLTLGADLLTQPQVQAHVRDRHWDYTLGYLPSLTLPDFENALDVQVLHVGAASVGWHERRVQVLVTEDATYGTFNSAYLAQPVQAAPSGQPGQAGTAPTLPPAATMTSPILVTPQSIHFFSSRTLGILAVQVNRRTSFAVDGGYLLSGGTDAASRAVVPEQFGPRADASFSYALTRRDHVVTSAYAQMTDLKGTLCVEAMDTVAASVPCTPEVQLVQVTEGVRHGLSPATSLSVDAGATAARTRTHRSDPYQITTFPSGRVALSHRTGKRGRLTFELSAQLAPLIDPRTGLVSNFAQGQVSVTDPLSHLVSFHAALTGAQTVPTDAPLAVSALTAAVEMSFQLHRQVELGLGESGAFQTTNTLGSFFFTYGYLAVTVHAPKLRF